MWGGVLSFQEKRGEGSWSQEDARMDASLSAVQPSVSIHRSANDEVNGSRCEEIFCVFRFGEWKNIIIMDGYLSIDVSLFVFFWEAGKFESDSESNPSRSRLLRRRSDEKTKQSCCIIIGLHRL